MNLKRNTLNSRLLFFLLLPLVWLHPLIGQESADNSLLNVDRIYNSREFDQEYGRRIRWIDRGNSYVTIERNEDGGNELIRYQTDTNEKSIYLTAAQITPNGSERPININNFSLSPDGTKVLIFTNSRRVWRSNTKGDYWVFDFANQTLKQIGASFPASSLMFAKFSDNNQYVGYVQDFNLYVEDFTSGEVIQLTEDGNGDIINGTFDWVYEEEFACRDGFRWNPNSKAIAFWQLDASEIGTFFMINNTDSVYSKPIPLQYPKVGEDPSACKVGFATFENGTTITWIPIPGDPKQHYIPGLQWLDEETLLIQQLNRKQNDLKVWTYHITSKALKVVYQEETDAWIDLSYPDITNPGWNGNDLTINEDRTAFFRMVETEDWRKVYQINAQTGEQTLVTTGNYDVASVYRATDEFLYFSASPENSTQRYLYQAPIDGKTTPVRITPEEFAGVNSYNISPNGAYAVHTHNSALSPSTSQIINLPDHKTLNTLVTNEAFNEKLESIKMPEVDFFSVTTKDGIEIDGRMIKPVDFDPDQTYPVLFHVYGEPWGQVATDQWIGMWNIMLAQKGIIVIDMDNRGTPCLKGSEWRKCIYRNIGIINARDQAQAMEKVLEWGYVDSERSAVWGWSGGGSMTLNIMCQYPGLIKAGMSVAPVSDQLVYDNVYQERYMGLPQENLEDFQKGSPISYADQLEGDLLIVHGTGDDNVHYQSTEKMVNALILANKQFTMMAYPNRSHGIYEGRNTRRHLYTLLTNYLLEKLDIE